MIEIFSDYIKNIALSIIFSVFISMLLPDNNFKKYIDIVLGFIIMIMVLNPVKDFVLKNDISFDLKVFNKSAEIENTLLLNQKNLYEENQREIIIKTYKSKLNEQINELVSQSTNLAVESINIEVNEDFDSNNFAEIQKIELYINEDNKVSNKNNIIMVDNIKIQNNTNLHNEEISNRNDELEKKIESLISDFYKLNKDNIYIIVHTK